MKKIKTNIRRMQITKAAIEAISEKGLKGFTISSIAGKVGITESNVYRHFRGKSDVVRSIIGYMERTIETVVEAARKETAHPVERLRNIFSRHIGFIENNKGIPRMILSEDEFLQDADNVRNIKRVMRKYLDELRDIMTEGVKKGVLRKDLDIETAAVMFLGLIQATAIQWFVHRFSYSVKERGMKTWAIYLKGIQR
jgi:AcrR family transcriptional regulator